MTQLRPTGTVSPDRSQLEVVDPAEPGGLDRPHMVTVPQYLSTVDRKYMATHPWEYPRKPYPQEEPMYRMGQGARKMWDSVTSSNTGSGVASGLIGAGGGLAGSYLLDALGYRLFGKKPMGAGGRTLSALAGALIAAGGQQYYRHQAQNQAQPMLKASGMQDDAQELMRIRQFLAAQVMAAPMPMDVKSRVLQMLGNIGGQQLIEISRIVAPLGGAMAGAAIARFLFGGSIIPQMAGSLLGGYFGSSALSPRTNAMGQQMI